MTEQQLIAKLQELKKISPRKEWVILIKQQLFAVSVTPTYQKADFAGTWINVFSLLPKKQFTYSLAALLFLVAGVYGITNFNLPSAGNKSTASLAAEADVKNNVEIFKIKSQSLSEASRNKLSNVSVALKEVKDAAKNLTEVIKKDPSLASKIALDINNNKSYLAVLEGNNLSEVLDVYKAIVEQIIKDLKNTTLTPDQQKTLNSIEDLDTKGSYQGALENALLLMNSRESNI